MAVRTPRKADLSRAGDRRLAALAAAGDESAFEAIFERHHRGLLSLCRHLLGSLEEAEDALQHTFAAAYRQLVEREPPEHLRAWLYATARNRCLDVLRRRRELPAERPPVSTAGLSEEVERRSDLRELVDDIGRLPEDQRAALVMSEIEELGARRGGPGARMPAREGARPRVPGPVLTLGLARGTRAPVSRGAAGVGYRARRRAQARPPAPASEAVSGLRGVPRGRGPAAPPLGLVLPAAASTRPQGACARGGLGATSPVERAAGGAAAGGGLAGARPRRPTAITIGAAALVLGGGSSPPSSASPTVGSVGEGTPTATPASRSAPTRASVVTSPGQPRSCSRRGAPPSGCGCGSRPAPLPPRDD